MHQINSSAKNDTQGLQFIIYIDQQLIIFPCKKTSASKLSTFKALHIHNNYNSGCHVSTGISNIHQYTCKATIKGMV